MTDGQAEAAEQSEDKKNIKERDPGAADGIEAADRWYGEGRAQDLFAGAVADRYAGGTGDGYRDALERGRSRPMAGIAITDRLCRAGKLMRLDPVLTSNRPLRLVLPSTPGRLSVLSKVQSVAGSRPGRVAVAEPVALSNSGTPTGSETSFCAVLS